jgi:hypothetical protein
VFRHPELIALLGLQGFWPGQAAISEIAVVAATLAVYVATSTAALRHYGEANRYIEFALWLVPVFVLSKYAVMGEIPAAIWFVYGAWVLATALKKYQDWSNLSFPSNDVLNEFVAPLQIGGGATVLTVPFSLGAAIHVRTQCRALMYQGSAVTLSLYEKFMEEIPYLKRDWRPLATEFNVTHVIAEKSYLNLTKDLMGWEYDFGSLAIVAETDRLVAYAVPGESRITPNPSQRITASERADRSQREAEL